MRRRLIPAALSIAAVSAGVLTAPTAGYAAPVTHGRTAETVTVKVSDRSGDVVAKTGTLGDLSSNSSSRDGFKPGHGTVTAPTAADLAIDLTKVTYRVRRTGPRPALVIRYEIAGPLTHSDKTSQTPTTYAEVMSFDGVETELANGYMIQSANGAGREGTGLFNKHGKVACSGFRAKMKPGARVVSETVPLSCLTAVGLRSSRLQSATLHAAVNISESLSTGDAFMRAAKPTVKETATIAIDAAAKTRRLELTPLGN